MEITDFAKGQIWGITPDRFDLLARKFHDLQAMDLTAALERAGVQGVQDDYQIIDGVAIIPISGTITKAASYWSYYFRGAAVSDLTEIIQTAITDPQVRAIVLDIDSPGGTVSGVEGLSQLIYEARDNMPIVAFANGMMASAAYWIGSAADAIVTEKTADIGSIGVLMVHTDWSEYDKRQGIKTTYLTAGKYKALGNDSEPLSDLARETFQAELDHIYGIFVDTVARNRGTDVETVKTNMAEGRIFIGSQAVAAGLADYEGSMDTAIELALSMVTGQQAIINKTGGMLPAKKEVSTMLFSKGKQVEAPSTAVELAAMFPEMAAELQAQGAKSINVDELTRQAVAAEQARIAGIVVAQFGDDAGTKIKAVIESGISAEQYAAVMAMNPPVAKSGDDDEAVKRAEMLAAIQASGADNPGAGDGSAVDTNLSVEDRCKVKWAKDAGLRKEFRDKYEAYLAYEKNAESGRIKILGK